MTIDDIRKEVEAINYNEVADKLRMLIEEDDHTDFINKLANDEGGTPEDKIVELFEEILEHRKECYEPSETAVF